ncbi:hypothetical protein IZ6_19530 [Terrihabitans soli]|uniref:Uncharacterized protein n=2 Tax=Terrihabitans soli TaxID=708113 RepID=A0A6S6QXD8_9HYPH|nr:hypothetical protein IZ6_19530 [Terrihabitans soli]
MAIGGLISGLLSYFIGFDDRYGERFLIDGVPMLPALFFGIVLALGIYYWETGNIAVILGVFLGVAIGWWAAVKTGGDLFLENEVLAGILAGLVGSAVTAATLWLAAKDFRYWHNVAAVLAFGAIAGALIAFQWVALFAIWQGGVAALAGYAVALRPRPRQTAALATVNK